jgi:hypothetical protein
MRVWSAASDPDAPTVLAMQCHGCISGLVPDQRFECVWRLILGTVGELYCAELYLVALV